MISWTEIDATMTDVIDIELLARLSRATGNDDVKACPLIQ